VCGFVPPILFPFDVFVGNKQDAHVLALRTYLIAEKSNMASQIMCKVASRSISSVPAAPD
jgi:hypothetical protein